MSVFANHTYENEYTKALPFFSYMLPEGWKQFLNISAEVGGGKQR